MPEKPNNPKTLEPFSSPAAPDTLTNRLANDVTRATLTGGYESGKAAYDAAVTATVMKGIPKTKK